MSGARGRTVRSFLTALLAVSGLVFSVSAYAGGQDNERGRERDDRREAAAQRQAAPDVKRAEPQRPVQPSDQARPAQPAPQVEVGRPAQGGGRIWQDRGWQVPARLPQAPTRLEPRGSVPAPAGQTRGWERWERTTPYRLYSPPEQQQPSEPRGRLPLPDSAPRAEPQRPSAPQDRPLTQPWRIDAGRPAREPERDAGTPRPPAAQDRPSAQPYRLGRDEERAAPRIERPPVNRERERDREQARQRQAPPGGQPPAQQGKGRLHSVPEAGFRGPEADQNIRIIRPEARERAQLQLRDRLREQNQDRTRLTRSRPTVDVVGNPIPTDTTILVRDKVSRLSVGFTRLRRTCGDPTFAYIFAPRRHVDYWDGYWDGFADGYAAGRHHWHGRRTVVYFYYAYYWSDPFWFAFYYPGYYPAVYHYWGWSPAWVYPERCYYAPAEYLYAPATPYRYYGVGYRVDQQGADEALRDIRRAWLDSDISTLAYHLTDEVDIRVYFDGEYEYSTTTEDYYAMTADAMATTQTVTLTFDRPIWLSAYEFFVTGRHVFYDPNGDKQLVYVSYRLRKLGPDWYIVSVGSSLNPIEHQYRDFRY